MGGPPDIPHLLPPTPSLHWALADGPCPALSGIIRCSRELYFRTDTTDWIGSRAMKEVKIDIDAVGGVDLERLGRSLLLHGERVGDGRYHVTGGEHDHWVDLYTTSHPRCDCGDHLWREQICKHILAALLREGHDRVVEALGRLFRRVTAGAPASCKGGVAERAVARHADVARSATSGVLLAAPARMAPTPSKPSRPAAKRTPARRRARWREEAVRHRRGDAAHPRRGGAVSGRGDVRAARPRLRHAVPAARGVHHLDPHDGRGVAADGARAALARAHAGATSPR